jgi:hypothetical protein
MEFIPESVTDFLKRPYSRRLGVRGTRLLRFNEVAKNMWRCVKDLGMLGYVHTQINPSKFRIRDSKEVVISGLGRCKRDEDAEMMIDTCAKVKEHL